MTDTGEGPTTTCDLCGHSAPWQETKDWVVIGTRCYHPDCYELHEKTVRIRTPRVSIPDRFRSDIVYQGDPFHD